MIQRFLVPSPADGQDWVFTIPGQYNVRLLSVQATLTALTPPLLLADISGNGRDATIGNNHAFAFGAAGPFAGGANNLGVSSTGVLPPLTDPYLARTAAFADFGSVTFTTESWVFVNDPADTNDGFFYGIQMAANTVVMAIAKKFLGGNPWDVSMFATAVRLFTITNQASTGAWHHYAVSWDGAQWDTYVDGVHKSTHVGNPPNSGVNGRMCLLGSNAFGNPLVGVESHVSYITPNLPAANIAAHAAANADAATYQAAVLADAPKGFWPMTEPYNKFQKTATLLITDGTRTVAQIPAPSPTASTGTYTWCWVAEGAGNAQTVGQTVTTIELPPLYLPPGYRISTVTPDLGFGDFWSDIVIWVDTDDTSGPGGIGLPGVSYLDGMLTPDYGNQR